MHVQILDELDFAPLPTKPLRSLVKGEYFQLVANGPMWVRGDYDRATKRFCCHKFDDVNHYSMMKPTRSVVINAIF